MLALLIVAAIVLAYANGSNDNFKAAATIYGSDTLDYRGALRLATAAQVLGSLASVALAGALIRSFSGKGLVPDAIVADPNFLLAVALGAAATVLAATRLGIPVSTTHGLIGALVGAGLAMTPNELAWAALGGKYFVPLLLSPILAVGGAALIYPVARWARLRLGVDATTEVHLPAISMEPEPTLLAHTAAIANQGVAVAGGGASLSRGFPSSAGSRRIGSYSGSVAGVSAQRIVDSAHVASAFSLGFARGLNDTPKILALLVAAGWSGINPRLSLLVVAIAMAVGGILHSRRLAETLGHRITVMNRGQGLVANTVASGLVIGASLMGSPVSTTHVWTGAIFGVGVWTGEADRRVIAGIVAAWFATLPLGALLAFSAARALALF